MHAEEDVVVRQRADQTLQAGAVLVSQGKNHQAFCDITVRFVAEKGPAKVGDQGHPICVLSGILGVVLQG